MFIMNVVRVKENIGTVKISEITSLNHRSVVERHGNVFDIMESLIAQYNPNIIVEE